MWQWILYIYASLNTYIFRGNVKFRVTIHVLFSRGKAKVTRFFCSPSKLCCQWIRHRLITGGKHAFDRKTRRASDWLGVYHTRFFVLVCFDHIITLVLRPWRLIHAHGDFKSLLVFDLPVSVWCWNGFGWQYQFLSCEFFGCCCPFKWYSRGVAIHM